jgi:hypothetical protein
LLTNIIACIAVYIAWQQWQTNHHRLKYDLFDKRYSVYKAACEFLSSIQREGKSSQEAQDAFLSGTRCSKFLFGEEVAEYFDNILYSDAIDLETNQDILSDLEEGEKRTKCAKEIGEIKKRILAHGKKLEELCSPYLIMRDLHV